MANEVYIKISDAAQLLEGKNIDKKKLNVEGNGLPYVVGASSMKGNRLVCKSFCENPETNMISHPGDIIISTVGTLGKLAVNDIGDCVLSKHVCAVRFVPSILPEYGLLCLEASLSMAVAEYELGLPDTKTGFGRKLDLDIIGNLPLCLIAINRQMETVERMVTLAESFSAKEPASIIPDFENIRDIEAWLKNESQWIHGQQKLALRKFCDIVQMIDPGASNHRQLSFNEI